MRAILWIYLIFFLFMPGGCLRPASILASDLLNESQLDPQEQNYENLNNKFDSCFAAKHTGSRSNLTEIETEVAGFSLQGKQFWHKLVLYDLDLAIDNQKHYLPFLKLLREFEAEHNMEGKLIHFKFPDLPAGRLDSLKKLLIIKEETLEVEIIEGISDISLKREIYLAPEVIARIFGLEMSWDANSYSYVAETKHYYPIWKERERSSFSAVQTTEMHVDLPEQLGPAEPEQKILGLDFIHTRARTNYQPVHQHYSGKVTLDSLQQTFWGDLARGRYKLQLSQPSYAWNNASRLNTSPFIRLNRAQWGKSLDRSRFWLGDSTFGFNDITFPTLQMTGLRFETLLGAGPLERENRLRPAARSFLQREFRFDGLARVGSTV